MGRGIRTPGRSVGVALAFASAGLALSGCSQETTDQFGRWGLPVAASDRAPWIGNLWNGAWIASMVIGVFVWGLIGWVVFRYRRKGDGETPRQNRYNLPLEILYTIVPVFVIGVLFFFTVQAQDAVAKKATGPVHTINVIGQKWSWTFNYMEADNAAVGTVVHEVGTIDKTPDLYLPVDKPVRFNLASADVDPLVLDPGVLLQARRHPRAPEHLRRHPDPGRHLPRQVRRALRHLPLERCCSTCTWSAPPSTRPNSRNWRPRARPGRSRRRPSR